MTIAWSPYLLVYADDKHDQDQATDGHSRFGAYLADRLDSFHEYDEPDTPLPPAEFAAAAWYVATPPVMAPGYVHIRPDLTGITLEAHHEDPGALIAAITLPLTHGMLSPRIPYAWGDWEPDRYAWSDDDRYRAQAPADRYPQVLTTVTVRVEILGPLPAPTATRGHALTADAKHSVRWLVDRINSAAYPIVAKLRGEAIR